MESKTTVTGAVGHWCGLPRVGRPGFVYGTATSESGAATISEQLQGQGHGLVLQVQDQESVDEGLRQYSKRAGAFGGC